MMTSGTQYEQRDIVMIPFEFSDLTAQKQRPAIIISNHDHNRINEDYIFCALTSNPREWVHAVNLSDSDLESGGRMPLQSKIKPTKIMTRHRNLIIKKIAKVNRSKYQEVIDAIQDILKQA